ncbi:MAG: redoxin family protein [Gammaproteobacteria bacterium]|nr:redoxin family protein [Gammaproteobacteria bacterium]MBU1414250.1 redoxin family protein [Gammaproteobacteria bacterium]
MNRLTRCLGLLLAAISSIASAAPEVPPHLSPSGQNEFREFAEAPDHRAFAIAPGGAWGWAAGKASPQEAEDEAVAICQGQTEQRCVMFAIDGRTVFDADAWSTLWRPYATAAQARKAGFGRERGQRMHDLLFHDAAGRKHHLAALKGKVVVLHFWGAWCPPCRREMPELMNLRQSLADRPDVAFVLLQAREKFAVSRQWAENEGIALPLFDSGSTGDDDTQFRLANGKPIGDREIANRFPTTYVLDRYGIVVFSHVGPVSDWTQYERFLRDLARSAER